MSNQRILITGSNGFIGSNIHNELKYEHDLAVVGASSSYQGSAIKFDLRDQSQVNDIIDSVKPDLILHLAGIADPNWCENNPQQAWDINYNGTKRVVKAIENSKTKLVYFSTDYVFDGESPLAGNTQERTLSMYMDKPNQCQKTLLKNIL